MFRGQFLHSVDQKGRVSLPARFRDALVANGDPRVVITPDPFDPCLHLYPLQAWEEFERKVSELPSMDPHIVRFRRMYVSPALECEVDRTGRVRIATEFRDKAKLTREILLAGMGRIIELWSKELWDAAMAMDDADVAEFKNAVRELVRV